MTATLEQRPPKVRSKAPGSKSIFDPGIIKTASVDALKKLRPRTMMRNPVMFIVEVGSVLTSALFLRDFGSSSAQQNVFAGLVAAFLWTERSRTARRHCCRSATSAWSPPAR